MRFPCAFHGESIGPERRIHRTARLLALLTAVLLLLPGCRSRSALPDYDYHIDMKPYESAVCSADESYLLLANKQHPLGDSFVPAPLSAVPSSLTLYEKEVLMESTAAKAAEALVLEMHALGYDDIVVTSGYRSYTYQQSLFHTYMAREREAHPNLSEKAIEEKVLTYSAFPGTSEHQTGLCMDLISTKNVVLDESFEKNPAFRFLSENAHHFGFILRYPKGKQATVGYDYEPWHYRFVGVKAATAMYEKGLTLEEYLK